MIKRTFKKSNELKNVDEIPFVVYCMNFISTQSKAENLTKKHDMITENLTWGVFLISFPPYPKPFSISIQKVSTKVSHWS